MSKAVMGKRTRRTALASLLATAALTGVTLNAPAAGADTISGALGNVYCYANSSHNDQRTHLTNFTFLDDIDPGEITYLDIVEYWNYSTGRYDPDISHDSAGRKYMTRGDVDRITSRPDQICATFTYNHFGTWG